MKASTVLQCIVSRSYLAHLPLHGKTAGYNTQLLNFTRKNIKYLKRFETDSQFEVSILLTFRMLQLAFSEVNINYKTLMLDVMDITS